jgi:hypothetical protein
MPTTGGARDCWLLIDEVCATAVAALTTICEGVTTAGDKPMVAAAMYALLQVVRCCNLSTGLLKFTLQPGVLYTGV